MRFISICLCLFISSQSLFSQTYQRIFRNGDRDNYVIDATLNELGDKYVLSSFIDTSAQVEGINLTFHDLKGNNRWSRDYFLPDSVSVRGFGEMIRTDGDSLIMTFRTLANGNFGQIMMKTDRQGIMDWSTSLGGIQQDTSSMRFTQLDQSPIGGYLTATQDSLDSLETVVLSHMSPGGSLLWSSAYSNLDTAGNQVETMFADMVVEPDSNILITGSMSVGSSKGYYLSRFDLFGNPLWSRTYQMEGAVLVMPLDIAILNDSSIVVVGIYDNGRMRGFVSKLTPEGVPVWEHRIELIQLDPVFAFLNLNINEVVQGNDGSVAVGGIFSILSDAETAVGEALMAFDPHDGTPLWSKAYERQNVPIANTRVELSSQNTETNLTYNNQGNLLASPDNGYVLINTSADDVATFESPQATPFIIKTDDIGQAMCEVDRDYVFDSINIIVDTLTWTPGAGLITQEIAVSSLQYFGISAPILSIEEVVVCPNLPVDTILDATIVNGISYEWATGDTTPIITVTETGDYPVTVTLDTETCFQLCDTAKVSTYDTLDSEIKNFLWDRWCTERMFGLDAGASGGLEPYNFEWNIGAMEDTFYVSEEFLGTNFIVTVTDACGQISITEQYIDEESSGYPEPDIATIAFRTDLYCFSPEDDRVYQLDLTTNGGPFDESTISWSTGSDDDGMTSIFVDGPGSYTVTLVDDCLYEIGAEIDFDVPDPAEIHLEIDESECFEQILLVTDNGDLVNSTIQWSTGAADDGETVIDVQEYGIQYNVTAVDNCNYTLMDSITVDADLEPEPFELTLSQEDTECGVLISMNATGDNVDPSTIIWTPESLSGSCNGSLECEYTSTLPGTVFVTMTDICGFEITQSIDIDPNFQPTPDPFTIEIDQNLCNSTAIATIAGIEGYDLSSVTWSPGGIFNGMDTLIHSTTTLTSYSVSLIDQCGLVSQVNFEIAAEIIEQPQLTIVADTIGFCDRGDFELTAELTGDFDIESLNWVLQKLDTSGMIVTEPIDGMTTVTIVNDTLNYGTYVATIADICGNATISGTFDIDETSFPACGICYSWPNIFFPNRQRLTDDDNFDYTFKPVALECNRELVDDYTLHIYNGYGNLVFESDDPDEGWNGNKNMDRLPGGVYIWYATWNYAGVEYTQSGDLTLMR